MPVQIEPFDIHNQKLVNNVHPQNWVNPTPDGKYNLVVIGAGTGGLISAIAAATLGAKVALIEKHLMGGDCLNVGCVPSKGLIRAARVYATVRDAAEFGVDVPAGTKVNFPKMMERMRRLRARISDNDSAKRYSEMGVEIFIGEGKFISSDAIEVDGKKLSFSKAIIATGARAAELPIPGLKDTGYLTNETIFNLTELPKRLAVIGSGPIGSEMAQSFRRFGSEVSILERSGQILPREDKDAAKIVQAAFEKDGIKILFHSKMIKVEKRGAEKVLHYEQNGKPCELIADEILVGIGRAPNVEGLGLDKLGIKYDDRKGVQVNEKLQTSNPRIYAVGDICFPFKFTHTAEALAGIAVQNALFFPSKKTSALTIPWCTYTDPEVAHVGSYAKDLEEKGIAYDTYIHHLSDVDRAILDGEDEGFIKVHAKKGTGKILGATIVAGHAGEMISEMTLAMSLENGLGTLAGTIHPYPTQAECMKRIGGKYMKTKLTPRVKGFLSTWLKWQR